MPMGTADAPHSLNPLYAPGLWDAVIITPPAASNLVVAK